MDQAEPGRRPSARGLLVTDEAQTYSPPRGFTAHTRSTLALSSHLHHTPPAEGLHNQIRANAVTQHYGLLSAPVQIIAAQEKARAQVV